MGNESELAVLLRDVIPFPLTATKDGVKLIFGFFIASEVNWVRLIDLLKAKGYDFKEETEEKSSPDNPSPYIFMKFEKKFLSIYLFSLKLKTKSLTEKELKSFIPHYVEKETALEGPSKAVMDWLKAKKGENDFYHFVEFNIEYTITDISILDKCPEKKKEIKNFLANSLEWIATQVIYSDLYQAVKGLQTISKTDITTKSNETTEDKTKTETTNSHKEKTSWILPSNQSVSPFAFFLQKNKVDFDISPKSGEKFPQEFKLGKKFHLSIDVKNFTLTPKVINLTLSNDGNLLGASSSSGSRFRIILESEFFSFTPSFFNIERCATYYSTVKPNVKKITAEEKKEEGYLVKIKLIDTIYGVIYPEKELFIVLDDPAFKISVDRPNFSQKGEAFNILFNFDASDLDVKVPLSITGKLGPDFILVNPPPVTDDKKFEIKCKKDVDPKKPKDNCERFTLKSQRAGYFRGFGNKAFFQFMVGAWKIPVKQTAFRFRPKKNEEKRNVTTYFWELRMFVFPILLDIVIALFAAVYAFALVYYPSLVPPISAELNVTTLTLPSSLLYLAYKVINWGRTLQSESK
jgi:hypothetical protein